jgi:hypothetical protein
LLKTLIFNNLLDLILCVSGIYFNILYISVPLSDSQYSIRRLGHCSAVLPRCRTHVRVTCTGHVHYKYLHFSLEPRRGPSTIDLSIINHQSINPFHQWIALYELSNSYKPGPPTQKAIQLLLNHLKKFYLIVRLWHLIVIGRRL